MDSAPLFDPLIGYGIAALVLISAGWFTLKALGSKPREVHVVRMKCGGCGWTGSHSKFNATCPKCAKPLLKSLT